MNWDNKIKLLKTNPKKNSLVLNEFKYIIELTEDEDDFPRKLLKYYNINAAEEQLNVDDINSILFSLSQ